MNRSAPSKLHFRLLATGTIVLASLGLSLTLPYANLQRIRHAHKFGSQAQALAASNPDVAAGYWEAGIALSPSSYHLVAHLAQHYQVQGKMDAAAKTWMKLPNEEGIDEAVKALFLAGKARDASELLLQAHQRFDDPHMVALRAMALAEMGQLRQAAEVARQAEGGEDDITTMLLSIQLLNDNQDVDNLLSRLSSPEALQRAIRLKLSKNALSGYFYYYGLLDSAEMALKPGLGRSSEAHVLHGRILAAKGRSGDAQKTLSDGIKLDPANIELHRLLADSYKKTGNHEAADKELDLVRRLERGRP